MTENTTTAAEPVAVVWMTTQGGWGAWVKVTVANTPEADKAAAEFFRRSNEPRHVDEDLTTPDALGDELSDVLFPTCEHGMSADLCTGPDHYPSREQEMQMGW